MKHKFASQFIIFSIFLALIFSALGVTPVRADVSAPWGANLVTNPGAETNNMSGWTTISNGGNGWGIAGEGHQGDYSFITSYDWDTRYQEIDLLAAGFAAGDLDSAPPVMVGEWFKAYHIVGDPYYFKVELRNAAHTPIASWDVGTRTSPATATATWSEQTHTFSGYGSGLRYIYLEDGGKDVEYWVGRYGAMMDDAYAMISTISVSPTSWNFGNQIVGVASSAKSFTFQNIGASTLNLGTLSTSGDFALTNDLCSGQSLSASGTCTFGVTFTPVAFGSRTGAVSIPSDGLSSPDTIVLSGTGISPFSTSPASWNFGNQAVGFASSAKSFTLTNTSTATFTLGTLSTSGDFSLTDDLCSGQSLNASGTCTFGVIFTPVAFGSRTGAVSIPSNVPTSPDMIALSGNGVDLSITTLFTGSTMGSGYSNMFDVQAIKSIAISSFDINCPAGAANVVVYYKAGTYVGSENNAAAWTLLGSQGVTCAGNGLPTPLPIGGLTIPAGQTYGLYIARTDNGQINYTSTGGVTYTNADLSVLPGAGVLYPFGTFFTPRTWNGTIYYSLNHTVTFHENGGNGSMSPQVSYMPANLTQNAFTRTGYTFTGWDTSAAGTTVIYTDQQSYSFSEDVDLYAVWTINSYTLTVNSAHGTVTKSPDQATYHHGDVVTLSVTPDAGWTFSGWTPSLTDNQVTITGNVTVTADYTQDEYSLTVNSAHGTVTKTPDQPTYHYGDVVTLSAAPDDGWTFVDWTPALTNNQATITGNTTVTANYRQIPVITWANPADIVYGTALSGIQLNATADVPGTFAYTPDTGAVLTVGTHTLHVDFTPTDTANFISASKDVSITVTQATPVLTWADPADIAYGTALSGTQLNATANTPGAFTYTPASGTVLAVGTHTLHVEFVPTDTVNFTNASKNASITVTQATTILTWANPANIVYGTALSGTQLNATANTPGAFTYAPASGTVLDAGSHTLHVDFTPTDSTNYAPASKDVSITVTKATPVLTWADPAAINQGTPLSATQLNATANVPGTFTYVPASGTVLSAGTHTLHVDFVPTDTVNYTNASRDVSITILGSAIFADVPDGYWARSFIEKLYLNQITGGCGGTPLNYCPETPVTRAQMAVFILKAKYGVSYTPPAATGAVFLDVAQDSFAAAFIEALAAEGITGGCGNGNYCPNMAVTRDQMAVFLLRGKYGDSYTPPIATGVFDDVTADYWAAPWIEALAAEGITGGCGNGDYCPTTRVTRAQMAVFLVAAFNLP